MKLVCAAVAAFLLAGCAQPVDYASVDKASCQGAGANGTRSQADCREQREAHRAEAARRMANSTPITGYGPIGRF